MNPKAAQEILDLIMLDDMVARRAALDVWTRRWVTTLHIEQIFDPGILKAPVEQQQEFYRRTAAMLRREMQNELAKDEVHVLLWGRLADNPNSLVLQMHVVVQEPRDVDEGADAAKRMMEMAKGERS